LGTLELFTYQKAFIMKKKFKKKLAGSDWSKNVLLASLMLLLAIPSVGQIRGWDQITFYEGKIWIGSGTLGSKAYFAGGFNPDIMVEECTSKIEIYDATTRSLDDPQYLSVPRSRVTVVPCGSKVLFAGGGGDWPNPPFYSVVDILDTNDGSWSVESLSLARATTGVSKGNIALFAGGITDLSSGEIKTTNTVDIYNCETGIWTTDTLSVARDAFNAVVVGDLAMIAGGFDGQNTTKRVDIYNFSTDQWTIDSLSVPRSHLTSTVVGSKAYFAGGVTQSDNDETLNSANSNVIDVYDADNGQWSFEYLPAGRAFLGGDNAATVCGKAYFVNGAGLDLETLTWQETYNRIDIFDPEDTTGTPWSLDFIGRHYVNHTVAAIETDTIAQLLIAGGFPGMATLDILDIDCPVISGVSASSLNLEIDYVISPNPASEWVNIFASFKNKTSGSLSLYNVLGHTTLYNYEFNEDSINHQIDVNSFAPGIYLLEVRTDGGRIVEKVMVAE
jgi:hypothetical protein